MRVLRRPLLALGILVAVWVVALAFQLWRAGTEAAAGVDGLRAIREQAALVDVLEGDLDVRLARARDHLARAESALDHGVLAPVRLLPVVGRQVRSADAILVAARDAADVATDAMVRARRLLGEAGVPTGQQRVALLHALADVASDAGRRFGGIELGPDRALVGSLARARQDVAGDLDEMEATAADAATALHAAGVVLQGPRRYLVLAANNAEMRVGSGMFLSAGVLELADGHLRLGEMGRTPDIEVPAGSVEPTGHLAARWGWTHPERDWRNLGFTPRFAATADLAARMWQAAGRGEVDGVVAVDVVAVEAVLAATGPVRAVDRTVAADEVVEYLLHGQYAELSDDRSERFERGEQVLRRERIGELAGAAVAALEERDWSLAELVGGLRDAVQGRHLLGWSRQRGDATLFDIAGADGTLLSDSLSIGLANVAGSKLDPFVTVRASIGARAADGATAVEVRVEIRNRARSSEAAYILGPDPATEGLGPGDYRGVLVANLPGAAFNGRIDGVDHLVAAGVDGPTRVVAATVEIPRGARRTFVVRFDLPAPAADLVVEPSARVPPIRWRAPGTRWRDDRRRPLTVAAT